MSSIIIFPYWREGRGNPTLPPTPQSLKRALGFFGYLAEAGRLDLRFFLLLRQRLHGIVIYPRADNLRATKLGFWHQIAVEAKPHEIIRVEDHLIIIPAVFAVDQFGDDTYLGALAILVLAGPLFGLGIVELLVPGRADVALLAFGGVDQFQLTRDVGVIDGELVAIVLGDLITLAHQFGGEDFHHRIVNGEHRGGTLLLLALLRDQAIQASHLSLLSVFGAPGAFGFSLRDCGLPKNVAAGQTITAATGPACCILPLIGDLPYRGCLHYVEGPERFSQDHVHGPLY